ncbi:hypothetical protein ACEWY4_015063 [Coilia grayii]|uniref:Sushi domain-containing protein n=1 Tax=Coilia grayii TaxID=363190 RepID=A0ABD1JU71_9TELE
MKTTLVLFCSVVCVASQTEHPDGVACTEPLPEVDNAEPSLEYMKESYTEGSLLPFSCKLGYVSAGRTVFSCSKSKWVGVRQGKCIPRPCELPEDIPNGSYETDGTDLVFGAVIKYSCNDGYRMVSRFETRVCMLAGWSGSLPVCEAVSCEPEDHPSLILHGLPEDDTPVVYGHKLQFACADSGMVLRGEQEVTCTSTGQWNHPFPKCEVVTCELGRTDPAVTLRGTAAHGDPVKYGETLHFTCAQEGMAISGEKQVTCTASGEWSAPFPKCEEITCARNDIHSSVRVQGLPSGNGPARLGTKLSFSCTYSGMVLRGKREVICLNSGRWSSTFPRCEVPGGSCGPPPQVRFADVISAWKPVYSNGELVQFKCQPYYILEGDKQKQCVNGEWTKTMRCREPCTVTQEDMDQRNIEFKVKREDLRYVPHNDRVTFVCKAGMRQTRDSVGFQQYCRDGHMRFPECS